MNPKISFELLSLSMIHRLKITLVHNGQSYSGIVCGIRIEDGSGKKFLVKLDTHDNEIFVHTV
jgi:hypothetical protein